MDLPYDKWFFFTFDKGIYRMNLVKLEKYTCKKKKKNNIGCTATRILSKHVKIYYLEDFVLQIILIQKFISAFVFFFEKIDIQFSFLKEISK